MDDVFKIYIEQLREGHQEKMSETLNPDFLEVHETDLVFNTPIALEGEAYLADRELILHWDITTAARVSCSICNEPIEVPIRIRNFYSSEPIAEIKTGIYNFKDLLRETILLEVPTFSECCGGNCPKRKEYSKYLKQPSDLSLEEEGYQPFADLDWKS